MKAEATCRNGILHAQSAVSLYVGAPRFQYNHDGQTHERSSITSLDLKDLLKRSEHSSAESTNRILRITNSISQLQVANSDVEFREFLSFFQTACIMTLFIGPHSSVDAHRCWKILKLGEEGRSRNATDSPVRSGSTIGWGTTRLYDVLKGAPGTVSPSIGFA